MSDWREQYHRRYQELKARGKSFFPYAVFKDICVAFLVLAALAALAHYFGAELEELADPTDTTYNPRPEWYFLFLFQALKYFPGKLEAVAAVVLPGWGVLILVLLPFLDRGPDRHPLDRLAWTSLGLAVLAGIAYLTWAGYRSPLSTNPIVKKDPVAAAGQRLYHDLKCAYCHSINGKGGRVGPDLAKVASAEREDWLTRHFRDPQSVMPGSTMPKMNLLDDEIRELVVYIKSLGGDFAFSPEAPTLFTASCTACHRLGKEGGDVGPDLSTIGSVRDQNYLKRYIANPTTLNPSAAMPGYEDQLTAVQMEDLARFLASQREAH